MNALSRILRVFLSVSILISGIFSIYAQTAAWKVSPQYSDIDYFAQSLYKVKKDRKTGIIDHDGVVKVRAVYDRISPIYEGIAIIYNLDSEGMEFKGIITENGDVTLSDDGYYLLPDYPFFSEGFLPVRTLSGKYGFLNADCRPAFPFTSVEVRPFSEGVAAVGDGDDFYMLTTDGEKLYIALPHGEYAYGGTNYYDGSALVWDGDWNCYLLNDEGRLESLGEYDLSTLQVDYLYRYGSGKGDAVEYALFTPEVENEWTPVRGDGKWTYADTAGHLLTPYQYDDIKEFYDGVAIASSYGKYGLLEIVEDKRKHNSEEENVIGAVGFYATVNKSRHSYSPGTVCECDFNMIIPEKWNGKELSVTLKDKATGKSVPLQRKGDRCIFSYSPTGKSKTEKKTYVISVLDSGKDIWNGEKTYEFNQRQRARLSVNIRVINKDANSKDKCEVIANIKNPSSEPVTTTVTLSGGGTGKASFANKTLTLTIPAHGSKSVSSAFTVKKVEFNGWCMVSTGDGVSKRIDKLELKPF